MEKHPSSFLCVPDINAQACMASRNLSRYSLLPFDNSWLCGHGPIFSFSTTPPSPCLLGETEDFGTWVRKLSNVGSSVISSSVFLPTRKQHLKHFGGWVSHEEFKDKWIKGKHPICNKKNEVLHVFPLSWVPERWAKKTEMGRSYPRTKVFSMRIYWQQSVGLCPTWCTEVFKDLRRVMGT